LRPDGAIVWITERGRALVSDAGLVERVVGVSRDVSAQRRAEQERERLLVSERMARDEAERQGRIKDEFLATLSHELRTPMNAILGWLSMLAKGDVVRDSAQAIAALQRNASIQAKLIEDLLEMNKLTSGTVRLELGVVDVRSAVDGAVQALKPMADAKSVRLESRLDGTIPCIHADERRVQQILWNLLHNGIKFTPAGGHVDVSLDRKGTCVQICVHDSGEGIAADFLPFVFDRFRQADSSTTRGTWGLGLGLSIVRHLVELHGGSVEASSNGLGTGATFLVRLPLRLPAGDAETATSESPTFSTQPLTT
jgi:signal transduction histidine kinase